MLYMVVIALSVLFSSAAAQDQSTNQAPPAAESSSTTSPNRANTLKQSATAPRTVYAPGPRYPKGARKDRLEGTAVLWLVVDRNGLPQNIKVHRSLRQDMDKAAVEAVEKWKFAPATLNGVAVSVPVSVEVEFRLH